MVGVGGAYIASAEDTEGSAVNAAAPAVRDPYSLRWFDYDLSVGISSPGAGTQTDFDNHGDQATAVKSRAGDFVDLNFGFTLQFGELGFAATGDLEQFSLGTFGTVQVGRWKVLGAYGLMNGQLMLGGGARILTTQFLQSHGPTLLTMAGAAPEVGALYMPTGAQWRLGAAARAPVSGNVFGPETSGVLHAGNYVLPERVVMPLELEFGAAYQLGPRPLNPGWQNPHQEESFLRQRLAIERAQREDVEQAELALLPPESRAQRAAEIAADEKRFREGEDEHLEAEIQHLYAIGKARYLNWPREKILLLASILLTGPSADAVSEADFLEQRVETVGSKLTATPRFGMEGEPLRDRMLLRIGSYVEPSRYQAVAPRQHFTFGGDVRLFPYDVFGLFPDASWKISFFVDLAPRYTNYGIGIGNWH